MKPYYEDSKTGVILYHGDAREVLPCLGSGSIDLLLTDPPYGVSLSGVTSGRGSHGRRNFDFFADDKPGDVHDLVGKVLAMSLPLMSASGSAYWWCGHTTFGNVVSAYGAAGWKTRFLVWVKENPVPPPPGAGWPSGAELCVYAFRPGRVWTHTGLDAPRSNVFVADSYRHGQPGKVKHPTQKPFGVINPLLKASACPGNLVLDPFAGSGTTLLAARDAGCRCIGIEIEERYCEVAAKRLAQTVFDFA